MKDILTKIKGFFAGAFASAKKFVVSVWMKYFDADVKVFIATEKVALAKDITDLKNSLTSIAADKIAEAKATVAATIEKKKEEFKAKIKAELDKKVQ